MSRQTKHDDEDARQFAQQLDRIFDQMARHYANVATSRWFYEGDACPGCGFPIDAIENEQGRQLSINAFIYRPARVLIGYFLCSLCARRIFEAAEINPGVQTPLHGIIEQNLTRAYLKYAAAQPPASRKPLRH